MALLALLGSQARATDLMKTAQTVFFNPADDTRVGIEVEYVGLSAERSAEIFARNLGGTVEKKEVWIETTILGKDANGNKVYDKVRSFEYVVRGSSIGDIVFKTDLNQTSDTGKINLKDAVVEMVSAPIRYPEVQRLQGALTAIKEAGARGTASGKAVAAQVNMEIAGGKRDQIVLNDVINLMRSYLRPEHLKQIETALEIPDYRKKFLKSYSDGMMQRLLDPAYRPTERGFYDDFIYRQSLEFKGVADAWTMPIEQARQRLLADPNPVVPEVVKLNHLRLSSLLMFMFPEDPMSKVYHESGWAVGRPLVEFRSWNTDREFDILHPVRQALGLKDAAREFGYYDHDRLLSALSGIDEKAIRDLREASQRGKRTGKAPAVKFRYFLGDPKTTRITEKPYSDLAPYYKGRGSTVSFLPAGEYGNAPVTIAGKSVVFHRRHFHLNSILGEYNPALANAYIQQALENKAAEYKFFEQYAPGSMSETALLTELTGSRDPSVIARRLQEKFPEGWVLKGTWDLGSETEIITDKIDIAGEIEKYKNSDFDQYRKRREAEFAGKSVAPEYLLTELKKHPGYRGWKISTMLQEPNAVIAQKRVRIAREFRVEVLGGKVLGEGSTVDRYWYKYYYGGKMEEYVEPPKKMISQAEGFAQSVVDRLPFELRSMPFAMDVAILEDGSAVMIESNPGGNSNFLFEEEEPSIKALERFMERFPKLVEQGKVSRGLTPERQMAYLRENFVKWGLSPEKHFPGMKFENDRIIDPEFKRVQIDPSSYTLSAKPGAKAFSKRREASVRACVGRFLRARGF